MWGTFVVKQNGHAVLTITLPGGKQENFLITLRESTVVPPIVCVFGETDIPSHWSCFVAKLQIQGLIWGSPYIELADSTAISSDTGYTATIDYKGKGR